MTSGRGVKSQGTRVEIGRVRFKNGQARADIKGFAGESAEELLMLEPHGFASSPPKGSTGVLLTPGDRRGMGMVMASSHKGHRPDVPDGAVAVYDAHGSIIKLEAGGVIMNFGSKTVTMTGGSWSISGNVTITGNLNVSGTIDSGGAITSGAPDGADE
jgi:phage gp45-like